MKSILINDSEMKGTGSFKLVALGMYLMLTLFEV